MPREYSSNIIDLGRLAKYIHHLDKGSIFLEVPDPGNKLKRQLEREILSNQDPRVSGFVSKLSPDHTYLIQNLSTTHHHLIFLLLKDIT